MAKLTLQDITGGFATVTELNANFAAIEAIIELLVSRDGTTPNTMTANFDMNGFNILNQGNPISVSGFNWEGAWVTATLYEVGDVIENGGSAYVCVEEHTSGTFSTDLTAVKWQLVAQASLPTQTTHSGKYLTTDGSTASWEDASTLYALLAGSTFTGDVVMSGAAIDIDSVDTVASAATTDLGAELSNNVDISGTASITSFGTANAGTLRFGRLTSTATLTHNATSLILPSAADITAAANDRYLALSLGSGNWIVLFYQRADGTPLVGGTSASTTAEGTVELLTTAELTTGTDTTRAATADAIRQGFYTSTNSATTTGSTSNVGSIPSWVTEIKAEFWACGDNGSGNLFIQLGDAGGLETTGYVASSSVLGGGGFPVIATNTTKFVIPTNGGNIYGVCIFRKLDGNKWVMSGNTNSSAASHHTCSGGKELSDTLTQIELSTANTFDSGSWTVSWS